MRFQVSKRDLTAALAVVGSSVSASGPDISSHFTFRRTDLDGGKHGLEILTYTGRIFSSCPLQGVDMADPGTDTAFTIESWRLKQWLNNIAADAAPEFTLTDREVVVRVKRGKQTFQSLDPKTFPYWDKALKKAESKARLPADRLAAALSYSRQFASDEETKKPEFCICEVRDGILQSSDKKAATLIRVAGLEKSDLRVHAKDVGGFLTFLGNLGDGEVEVLEHERMLLLRCCATQATFGEARFHFQFPLTKVNIDDIDQHTWTLPKEDLQQIIGFLISGAKKEDNRLHLAPGSEDGEILVSMANTTGKDTSMTLSGVTKASQDKAPSIPEEGFTIDHTFLAKVLSPWKEDNIVLGINVQGDKGFVRLARESNGCKFLTVLPWLR